MKLQAFSETLKEVIGGTPVEVGAKILVAIGVGLWDNAQIIGTSLIAYGVLLLFDALMGQALARRAGRVFSFTHFIYGPGKKLALTAGMLLCTSFVDGLLPKANWIPDSPLFFGAAAFICVTQLIDVAKKYGTLSGSKVANWIEAKLGSFIKYEEPKKDA